MSAKHWFGRVGYLGAVAFCGASFVAGCGAADAEFSDETGAFGDEAEAVDALSEPLLTIPGGFYTQAPDFAWCGVAVSSVSANCHGGYSANSSGGTNTYTRISTGRYRVTMPGLPAGGNVQLTTIGSNSHCSVLTLGTGSTSALTADVHCRTTAGALADTRFLLSYYRDTNVGGSLGAYASVRGTTSPTVVSNTWNSSGGAISALRTGTGTYRVTFAGQNFGADTAQVSAIGYLPRHCTVGGWGSSSGVHVDVTCFDFAGNRADAEFSVAYHKNVRGEPRNTLPTGTQGGFSLVFTPGGVHPAHSRNSCPTGSNTATIFSGVYQETFHAVTDFQGEVPIGAVVTALSTTGAYCSMNQFPIQGVRSDSRTFVKCYSPDGQTVSNVQHTSMVFLDDKMGPC